MIKYRQKRTCLEMFKITEINYKKVIAFFQKYEYCALALKICYSFLPLLLFIGYPVLISYVIFCRPHDILRIILVPFGVFLLVSVLRRLINEQRPYEKYGVQSLFGKTTKGQSIPSRHTASAFIISLAMLYVSFDLGVAALSVSLMITLSRVLAGVHFIRDVLAAMLISVLAGIVFFFLI